MAVHLLDLVGRGDERATELPGMVTAQLEGFRVADLSWSIVQATASRNGIPPHAPTLAAAAAAGTGLTPTELEALRQDALALQGGRFDPRVPCPLRQAQRAVRLRCCETRT